MAVAKRTKSKANTMSVYRSSLKPGVVMVSLGEHIIGTIEERDQGASIRRLKVDRNEEGKGIFVKPKGALAKPFDDVQLAADAVLTEWRRSDTA